MILHLWRWSLLLSTTADEFAAAVTTDSIAAVETSGSTSPTVNAATPSLFITLSLLSSVSLTFFPSGCACALTHIHDLMFFPRASGFLCTSIDVTLLCLPPRQIILNAGAGRPRHPVVSLQHDPAGTRCNCTQLAIAMASVDPRDFLRERN